jgi:SPP1 family predicted phage head-tail adaptor
MTAIAAGQLKHRIRIQECAHDQDDTGEVSKIWQDVATLWADIQDISGREFLSADAQENEVSTKITIRYRVGIVPAMRVLYRETAYNIHAVLEQDRVTLLLMCARLTA